MVYRACRRGLMRCTIEFVKTSMVYRACQQMCMRYTIGFAKTPLAHRSLARYWYELTDGFWGQFLLTQFPHQYAKDLLPQQ